MEVIAVLFALLIWVLWVVLIAFAIASPLSYLLTWMVEGYMKVASRYNKKRTWR